MKFGGSASANVQKTTQNSNNNSNIDATSQGRTASIWDAANGSAQAGQSPLATQAGQTFSGYQQGGNLGFSALTGNADAAKQFMNPYQSQVIDQNNAQFAKTQQQSVNTTNDAATKAGAFGGSRHGVAEGVALGNNAAAHDAQNAQLLQSGYNGAMQQAGTAANLGFGAAQQNVGAMTPEQFRLAQLKQGYLGPQGTTSQTSGAQTTAGAQTEGHGGIGF